MEIIGNKNDAKSGDKNYTKNGDMNVTKNGGFINDSRILRGNNLQQE